MFWRAIVRLYIQIVWEERCLPSEWRDALLIPVSMRRELCCVNWQGISLLDMIDKLFARVLNGKLQLVVEGAVSYSQCRFRARRGCVNMIFWCLPVSREGH